MEKAYLGIKDDLLMVNFFTYIIYIMNPEKKETKDLFIPQECIKVISPSAIFYPLAGRSEEGLTLFTSMVFLLRNFKETLTSFTAGDQVVVLQIYNGMLFYIQSHHRISDGLLLFLLQIIHDIAVFIFGKNFETFMSNNINEDHRKTYAKCIETFFELCNKDYKYLLCVPDIDVKHSNLSKFLKDHNPFNQIPIDPTFVECVLFFNHKIIGRYKCKQSSFKSIDQRDLFQLALNERVNFSSSSFSSDTSVSEDFSKESIKYRRVYLYFNNSPQCCFLSEAQLGQNSSFVITLVFKREQPTDEIREQIYQIIKGFITLIKSFDQPPLIPKSFQITGLLHYLLVNRTTGHYYEMLKPNVAYPIFTKIQRKMASVAMMALQTGNFVMFENQMKFQFTYELKFRRKSNVITPTEKLKIQPGDISYSKIVTDLFPNDSSIQCFELMTVYLGVMNTKDVIDANKHLFDSLVSAAS